MTNTRIDRRFAALKQERRAGLVCFITAGDPDGDMFEDILAGMPAAGADFIEVGMPFSDPQADGPAIQLADIRALENGQTVAKTLLQVARFRTKDDETPVILMGYYNPVYKYGVDRFLEDAEKAGVDGMIIVDLPPEEDDELCLPAMKKGLNFIRLATPTTDDKRLPTVLGNTSGFVYYVSVAGITGTKSAETADIEAAVSRLKRHTELPIAVGFGIKSPEQAADVAKVADAAVVGSALVSIITDNLDKTGAPASDTPQKMFDFTAALAEGVRNARQ